MMQRLFLLVVCCGVMSTAFHTAYDPTSSRQFDAAASTSFTAHTEITFDLSYADSTKLHGFAAVDWVEMGQFRARVPVGIITNCNSPDFNGVDGILGFGCKKRRQNLPTPLFWAMTDPNNMHSNARHIQRKFSFFSTQNAAELQLGGYDPETTIGDMWFTDTSSPSDFIVGVSSLTFGVDQASAVELINFSPLAASHNLPAIMDSGTSCLVIPGSNLDGALTESPFAKFAANWAKGKSFWITLNGKVFEIPFESWFLMGSNETCVQETPAQMNGLLIGDVFFRSWLVQFDMTSAPPQIGIAKLNTAYAPVTESVTGFYTLEQAPVSKMPLVRGSQSLIQAGQMMQGVPSPSSTEVDQIPVFNKKGTQYFVDLKMGTPAQTFTVIFDTGSSVFGVFVKPSSLPPGVRRSLPTAVLMETSATDVNGFYIPLDNTSMAFTLFAINAMALGAVVYIRRMQKARPHGPLAAHVV
mmetsp:Transcript_21969/g.51503  ORF Transcript_21969/g.51503 Transcript_21969/m.51503 type:complete len:469 (+) Transcript_21969:55-1461(+)